MDWRNHRRAVLTLALWGLGPGTAVAQPNGAPPDNAARGAYRAGVAALREERFDVAASAFERSYTLAPRAPTMCNLALAFDRWGDHEAQAIAAYDQCAAEDQSSSGQYADHAAERAAELRAAQAARPPPVDRPPAARPPVQPPPAWPPRTVAPTERNHTLLWVGVGAGAAAVASLIGAILSALSAIDDVDYLRRTYGSGPIARSEVARAEDARSASNRAVVLYVISGVAAAAGAALVAADLMAGTHREDTEPAVTVAPLPGGMIGAISGRF